MCQLPEPGPAPSGRLEKGCGARKQTTSTPSAKLGKAACSCPLTALSVSQSFCPVYSPPHQPLKVNVWASKRSCPPKCAPATALRRPRHAPLPSCSLHGTALPFEQHTADSFSRSKLRRPFLPPADTGRPTRGLNRCGTNMTSFSEVMGGRRLGKNLPKL